MPGRAEPALDAAVLEEGGLERAQLEPGRETLDGGHLAALGLQREVRAAVHRLAVEQHHAGAALRVVAALLRSRQADGVPHRREETRARLELDRVGDAVDAQRGGDPHAPPPLAGIATSPPRARASAAPIARRAITSAIARR